MELLALEKDNSTVDDGINAWARISQHITIERSRRVTEQRKTLENDNLPKSNGGHSSRLFLRVVKRNFNDYDKDGDGNLNRDELKAAASNNDLSVDARESAQLMYDHIG